MLAKELHAIRNNLCALGTAAASLLPRTGGPAASIDPEAAKSCLEAGSPSVGTECRFAEYHRQQEHFLFEVIRLGELPMRNIIKLVQGAGRITRCLAENYPSARVATLDPAHLDIPTRGGGAPVSDAALLMPCRGHAGPEVGAPVAMSRYATLDPDIEKIVSVADRRVDAGQFA